MSKKDYHRWSHDSGDIRIFSEKNFPIFNHSIFYPSRKRKYELDLPFLQKMVRQKKEIYQPSDEEAPLRNQVSIRARYPRTNRGWAQGHKNWDSRNRPGKQLNLMDDVRSWRPENCFAHTEKGMNPESVLMMLNRQLWRPLRFTKGFEAIGTTSRVHNYEISQFSNIRPTGKLSQEKGMSSETIQIPLNCSLVCVLVNRHTTWMISGHYKKLWADLCEKIGKITQAFGKNHL